MTQLAMKSDRLALEGDPVVNVKQEHAPLHIDD
jgi:hypothetical protein